jgi:hypothetical protein
MPVKANNSIKTINTKPFVFGFFSERFSLNNERCHKELFKK